MHGHELLTRKRSRVRWYLHGLSGRNLVRWHHRLHSLQYQSVQQLTWISNLPYLQPCPTQSPCRKNLQQHHLHLSFRIPRRRYQYRSELPALWA